MAKRFEIRVTKRAKKDIETLTPKQREKLKTLLQELICKNPFGGKKLHGDLSGSFSYRLNFKDRIIYSIDETRRIIFVERARTHYGD